MLVYTLHVNSSENFRDVVNKLTVNVDKRATRTRVYCVTLNFYETILTTRELSTKIYSLQLTARTHMRRSYWRSTLTHIAILSEYTWNTAKGETWRNFAHKGGSGRSWICMSRAMSEVKVSRRRRVAFLWMNNSPGGKILLFWDSFQQNPLMTL